MAFDFDTLFREDFYGIRWTQPGTLRTINWSTVEDVLELSWPRGETRDVTLSAIPYLDTLQRAFDLWDAALDTISFTRTNAGNAADVALAFADIDGPGGTYGWWTGSWGAGRFSSTTIHFDPADIGEDRLLTTALHEIGNVLGLGDIRPVPTLRSVQEDPFPETFSGDTLWDDDVAMIRQWYGEPGQPAATDSGDNAVTLDAGDNLLSGGDGNDTLTGLRGDDTLAGGGGDDVLSGGPGADDLLGEDGADTLTGGAGRDRVDGGAGNDALRGQRDADHLVGSGGDDNLKGGGGNDTLTGGDGDDFLNGGTRRDLLEGGAGDDRLIGRSFSDTLVGGAGNDYLNAGGDADRLDGGTGVDTLKGGDGADVFVFDAGFDTDTILDFDMAEDRLEIAAALAAGRTPDAIADLAFTGSFGIEIDFGAAGHLTLLDLHDTIGLAQRIDIA